MSDVLNPDQRHRNMSSIHGKNTKPELMVRKFLFSKGFRYLVNDARYPGRPDIVLPKYHTVVFVHGCFWHQHPGCKAARIPETNREYWESKLRMNVLRDADQHEELIRAGWKVIVIWECEISRKADRQLRLETLVSEIKSKQRL